MSTLSIHEPPVETAGLTQAKGRRLLYLSLTLILIGDVGAYLVRTGGGAIYVLQPLLFCAPRRKVYLGPMITCLVFVMMMLTNNVCYIPH